MVLHEGKEHRSRTLLQHHIVNIGKFILVLKQ